MKFFKIRSFNYLFLLFSLLIQISYSAQQKNKRDSTKKKNIILNTTALGATSLSYYGLYNLWYKKYPQTSFHFFNDLEEWNYIDKAGHIYSSYQVARKSHLFLVKKDIENPVEKSCFYSLFFMLGIEVLDGFSKEWGFSNYDLLSNFIGTGIFYFQEKKFKRQLLKLKFSSHLSPYAIYRPSLLGENVSQRIFKDYNGQTYWLTFDLNNKIQERLKVFKYLNFSLGYSIDGFVGARNNNILNCADCNEINRQSQLLLSIDLDLSEIKTKNRALQLLLNSFSIIKFPAPTIILQDHNEFRWFYF
tara:strand:+ start:1837 stop:2745 length:909 start_codon:yes stop_codon:yes gene_type:complete